MRIIPLLLIVLVATPAAAEVYRWVDDDGTVHFADSPPEAGDSERVELRDVNTAKSVEVEARGANDPETDGREVVMYGTSWCGYCAKARRYFEANAIPFTEYDVEESRKGRRDFERMGGGSVPVILIGDRKMVGFSVERFERLYEG